MNNISLTREEKLQTLKYVRNTIKEYLGISTEELTLPDNPVFNENIGVFVTINKHGHLRGCIGYVIGFQPLKKSLKEVAISAAFKDPRFIPLSRDEIEDITIEITLLSPMEKCNISNIVVGRDGLMMRKNGYSGLLLPQVPVEYNWSKEEFLENTCMKAGLPNDCYKDESVEIYKFTGYIFSEVSV